MSIFLIISAVLMALASSFAWLGHERFMAVVFFAIAFACVMGAM